MLFKIKGVYGIIGIREDESPLEAERIYRGGASNGDQTEVFCSCRNYRRNGDRYIIDRVIYGIYPFEQ